MFRFIALDPMGSGPAYIKDYAHFDKVSKLNVEFALMEYLKGNKPMADHILGGTTIDQKAGLAVYNGDSLVFRAQLSY
jgi:hypothetical protein